MSFGKDAPPLPMYEHKVLKHVPTMVRRRYDRDLDDRFIATLGFPYEDGESRGDHDGAEPSNNVAVTVSDANYEYEEQIQAEFYNELDSQTYTDDTGMFSEDSRSESEGPSRSQSGGAEDENIVYVGLDVAEDSKNEDIDAKHVNIESDYVADTVQDEVEEKHQRNSNNIQGFVSEDSKSLVYYGPEESCSSPAVVNDLDDRVVRNEVQETRTCSPADVTDLDDRVFSNEVEETRTYTKDFGCNAFKQSTNYSRSEYKGAEDTNLLCNRDPNFEDETEGDEHVKSSNEQDDSKSESAEAEYVMDANVVHEIEGDEDVKSDNEQDICLEECKIEDINGAIDEDALENHVGSSVKNEVHQDSEQDLNVVEDSKIEGDGVKDIDIVDDDVQDKTEETDHENSENEQDICSNDCIEEDDEIDVNILANNEDDIVQNEVQENDLGLHVVHDSKSEGDGTEDVDIVSQDVDDSVQDEVQDIEQDLNIVEDSKSEGDETKDVDIDSDSSVDDIVQDKAEETDDEISENEQDICLEDCIEEDDGAIDAKILENNEVQENDLVQDSKSEGDEIEDVNIASRDVDDSVQDEVEDKVLEILESKQEVMLVEDSKSEVDATIDANVDDSVKDEVLDIEDDNKQDESKSEGEEVKHDDLPNHEDFSVEIQDKEVGTFSDEQAQQEFVPELFKEILEKDGIDLCCPNCENEITDTVIFQKKEDIQQQHQTTCCSFLTTIFSCMPTMVAHWRTNHRSHLD